jgi:hypothetical protein
MPARDEAAPKHIANAADKIRRMMDLFRGVLVEIVGRRASLNRKPAADASQPERADQNYSTINLRTRLFELSPT